MLFGSEVVRVGGVVKEGGERLRKKTKHREIS